MTPAAAALLVLALIAGLAGGIPLTVFVRRHLIEAFDRRRTTNARPARGVVSTSVVDQAAYATTGRDDTRVLPAVANHRPRHGADRDDLVEQLRSAGWTPEQLRANAGHHIPDQREGGW